MLTMALSTAGCQRGPWAMGPFGQRDTRRRPGLLRSAQDMAGFPKPACPSLEGGAPLRRQDDVRLQRSSARRRHCSHAYLDKALIIRIEATVTSHRQGP